MADITGEGYAKLYKAGILSKQEIRDALGFPGVLDAPQPVPTGAPENIVPMPGTVAAPLTQQYAAPLVQQFVPAQIIAPQPAVPPKVVCPVHGVSRWVPGGISKKTQKAYTGFWACDTPREQGCSWKS